MTVEVRAKPGARKPKVVELGPNKFAISVSEPPEGGQANIAVARALAAHLKIPISAVFLKHGASSRDKVFEIL